MRAFSSPEGADGGNPGRPLRFVRWVRMADSRPEPTALPAGGALLGAEGGGEVVVAAGSQAFGLVAQAGHDGEERYLLGGGGGKARHGTFFLDFGKRPPYPRRGAARKGVGGLFARPPPFFFFSQRYLSTSGVWKNRPKTDVPMLHNIYEGS